MQQKKNKIDETNICVLEKAHSNSHVTFPRWIQSGIYQAVSKTHPEFKFT